MNNQGLDSFQANDIIRALNSIAKSQEKIADKLEKNDASLRDINRSIDEIRKILQTK